MVPDAVHMKKGARLRTYLSRQHGTKLDLISSPQQAPCQHLRYQNQSIDEHVDDPSKRKEACRPHLIVWSLNDPLRWACNSIFGRFVQKLNCSSVYWSHICNISVLIKGFLHDDTGCLIRQTS